jgi:imidazoleglycerol-phosphate dehydratase|tara:strand:+ start:15 stop:617 length:603 start_codon:yes stop_codon:yes gene_type:complete
LGDRQATLNRETGETKIDLTLNLDGTGIYDISTGNGFLDHMIAQLARHGLFDINLKATGDLETGWHHLVEDCGLVLGKVFSEALGAPVGIVRMAHSFVPLDETLAMVAVDLSGRPHAQIETGLEDVMVETLPGDLISHFIESFAHEARINIHAKIITGQSGHHKAEALFKALARSLRQAVAIDDRAPNSIPSTKNMLDFE